MGHFVFCVHTSLASWHIVHMRKQGQQQPGPRPNVPNVALLSPANIAVVLVAALGMEPAETKGTSNLITRGAKACRHAKVTVSTSVRNFTCYASGLMRKLAFRIRHASTV